MTNFDKLNHHSFIKNVLKDSSDYDNLSDEIKEEQPSELDYYKNNVTFFVVHLLTLFEQLQNAVDLLSNYNYSKNDEIGRGKHLTYNVENYIIRVVSISDRLLQTINAVFHIGINEKDVNERIVMNSLFVDRSNIPKLYNELRKSLGDFSRDRNTVIHRHSYINKELFRIEKLYQPLLTEEYFKKSSEEEIERFKNVRKTTLTTLIKKTKQDFKKNNEIYFEKILPIFDILNERYNRIKLNLK